MSNVMKDLVSQDLTGQTEDYGLTYEGKNTRKTFGLLCGYESQYVFEFEDNIFMSGNVGFHNSTITNVNDVPFQIGDLIQIQQNPFAWGYTGITSDGYGFTKYSSNQPHSFLQGQTIQVQGQTTLAGYNGYTTVKPPAPTSTSLNASQYFIGDSTQPGFIYGTPRPQYNTTATITGLYVLPVIGLVVETNLPWGGSSVKISGQITYPGNQLKSVLNQYTNYSAFNIYNAHINKKDYSIDAFDPYVIRIRDVDKNNISTILNQSNCYRIEPSSIGFLLSHTPPSATTFNTGMAYEFFNSNGVNLGITYLPKAELSHTDWYSPIGLEQISKSPYVNYSGVFSSYSGSVSSYNTYVYYSGFSFTRLTNKICFKLNQDCSKYEVYHLMWKDQYGSFISYPFVYVSRDFIESEKKTYYKQEGKWDNNTFSYDDYGSGEKVFYERSRESLTINSGWLYEFERDLIKDLIQSPSVYIQTPQNRIYSCHLDAPKVELYKEINDQLFNYTFNVRLSNNETRF
jgi:hypothetical protein